MEDFFELKWAKGGCGENIPQTETCEETQDFSSFFFFFFFQSLPEPNAVLDLEMCIK